eukprot:TRINITY_DN38640_c0_g1_i1.p1 TRINITY_DN38640_c0_g1~~TRINITY_DN38640_c0_g1_i1.p1  ORF type:complete len:123 (+),score=39.93 TRINITY_DN38640_c0_g1_i1:29-370(+)
MVKFALANKIAFPLIVTGMYLTYLAAFHPTEMPLPQVLWWVSEIAAAYPKLWPTVFYSAVALHALEALYVLVKAIGAGTSLIDCILWFCQTLTLGFPSTVLFLNLLKRKGKQN